MTRQRVSFIRGFLCLAILAGAYLLQGCGAEAVVEPENVSEIVEWCSAPEDYYKDMSDVAKNYAPGITVEGCFPGGKGRFDIETRELHEDQVDVVLSKTQPFVVNNLLAYFKVKYQGSYVTEFAIPLEIRISYTAAAWDAIQDQGYSHPRVAYLIAEDDGWGDTWVEIMAKDLQLTLPDPADPESFGFLYIKLDNLPDPLIGGC